jgi:hypothetical protein
LILNKKKKKGRAFFSTPFAAVGSKGGEEK